MRQCYFCDNAADSKDHAWPKWLASRLGSPTSVTDIQIGDRLYVNRSKHPEVTVRSICCECNNGWMSNLENDAKPVIELLLSEESGFLNVKDRHILAAWTLKTSMVCEPADRANADFYTRAERYAFRRFWVIPEYTWIWISGVREFDSIFTDAHLLWTKQTVEAPEALLTTIAFGNFTTQILTFRPSKPEQDRDQITFAMRDGPWDDVQLAVWPHPDSDAKWPRAVGLRGREGIDCWASRFRPPCGSL